MYINYIIHSVLFDLNIKHAEDWILNSHIKFEIRYIENHWI